MTPEERFAWLRLRKQRYLTRRTLNSTARGCMTGRLTKAIQSAADSIHLPVSNVRDIRLALATRAYGRPVATFNDLQDAELWALDQWIRQRIDATAELKDWLQATYGEQPALL
jgi:hypothetical protein